jgi:hypothetical protein
VTEVDFQTIIRQVWAGLVGPLDGQDVAPVKIVRQAKLVKFSWRFQPVQVCVDERELTLVFVDQHKGRTADAARRRLQPGGDASDKHRFPRSQLSKQGQHFTSLQGLPDEPPEMLGRRRRP